MTALESRPPRWARILLRSLGWSVISLSLVTSFVVYRTARWAQPWTAVAPSPVAPPPAASTAPILWEVDSSFVSLSENAPWWDAFSTLAPIQIVQGSSTSEGGKWISTEAPIFLWARAQTPNDLNGACSLRVTSVKKENPSSSCPVLVLPAEREPLVSQLESIFGSHKSQLALQTLDSLTQILHRTQEPPLFSQFVRDRIQDAFSAHALRLNFWINDSMSLTAFASLTSVTTRLPQVRIQSLVGPEEIRFHQSGLILSGSQLSKGSDATRGIVVAVPRVRPSASDGWSAAENRYLSERRATARSLDHLSIEGAIQRIQAWTPPGTDRLILGLPLSVILRVALLIALTLFVLIWTEILWGALAKGRPFVMMGK